MLSRFGKSVWVFFICFTLVLFFFSPSANALGSLGLVGSKQDYYVFDARPGDVKSFDFLVQNRGDKDTTVLVYPSDQLTGENGGAAYTPMDQQPFLYGLWLNQDKYELTLSPGEERKLTYTLSVPDDIEPGQYIAVVALGEKGIRSSTQTVVDRDDMYVVKSNYDIIVGKQIVVNVETEKSRKEISVDSLDFAFTSAGTPEVLVTLRNNGTILQKPSVVIEITGLDGKQYPKLLHTNSLSFYGGTTQTVRIPYSEVLSPGEYSASVTVDMGGVSESKGFKFNLAREEVREAVTQAVSEEKMVISEDVLGFQERYLWFGVGFILLVILFNVIFFLFYFRRKRKKSSDVSETSVTGHEE